MKIALITGASSGFGKAIAEKLAAEKWNLILTGRRSDRLQELSHQLETRFGIKTKVLCFDVRQREEVSTSLQGLPSEWQQVDALINNAGLALGRESIESGDIDQWEQMIDTNLKGLLYVSRIVSAWMIARASGSIINIGSIAGRDAYPGGNVYCASKAAVDMLTRNMRIDLLPHNIRVGQIAPGAADTEFSLVRFSGDAEKAKAVYRGFEPLIAADIADAVIFMLSRPPHVCINDMVIMPTAQANATTFHKAAIK